MSLGVAAVFGVAGDTEVSGFVDAGTLGDGAVSGVGPSSAFGGQVYTVMMDAGGLSVVVVVCTVAVEVVVYVMTMVLGSELVFGEALGVSVVPGTLEGMGRIGEVMWTVGALGI